MRDRTARRRGWRPHPPLALLLLQLALLHGLAKPQSPGAFAQEVPDELPSSGPALTALGSQHLDAGRLPEALTAFRKAARLFPGVSLAHYNSGIAASRAGELAESADAYRQALSLSPAEADTHARLGSVLQRLGQHAAAGRQFQESVALRAAGAALSLNDKPTAERLLRLASRCHPSDPRFGALGHVRMAHNHEWRTTTVPVTLGHVLMAQNRHAEAFAILRGAARMMGISPGMGLETHSKVDKTWVEVLCGLVLSMQRSAHWGFFEDTTHSISAYKALISEALRSEPSLLHHCSNPTHAWEVGLSPGQVRLLADHSALKTGKCASSQTILHSR
ncbi:hypothetical protein T484DRAFT_1797489 [Baffinella frigidus]|nr:hypothetical protein T484DRAFT_1797489 [Cryptophyta sp. CCMP2293]